MAKGKAESKRQRQKDLRSNAWRYEHGELDEPAVGEHVAFETLLQEHVPAQVDAGNHSLRSLLNEISFATDDTTSGAHDYLTNQLVQWSPDDAAETAAKIPLDFLLRMLGF